QARRANVRHQVAQQAITSSGPKTTGGEQRAEAVAPISLSDSDGQELILEDFATRTAIQGMLSLTEMEFRFRNPKARRMEGRFSCTLPANAAISRFAKEVNGQLMEGEVVERLKANQVYEQFLHQMRDPALLEQDQGNRFSARIFPIEANASVRIVLSYTALLPLENGVRHYRLPLRGLATVGHFSFRAFVTTLPGEQEAVEGTSAHAVGGLSGATHSTADVVSIDETDYTPPRDIELSWRPTAATAARDRVLRAGDFYLASFRPAVGGTSPKPSPSSWLFYIDTSASSAEGSEHRIEALATLLASLPPSDRVQLRAFDQEIVTLATGSAAELSAKVASLLRVRLFLGGTDMGALLRDVRTAAQLDSSRAIVIASDLVATLGVTDRKELTDAIHALPPSSIVDVLVLGSRQDAAMARAITAGHGRVVSIQFSEAMAERANAAAGELRRPLGASLDLADASAQWVYPSHFDDVQNGDEVIALGRLKGGADPAVRIVSGSQPSVATIAALPSAAFAPLLEREAYRAYLDYLAEREANEPAEAVRSALATEQVKVSLERRVVIPRTTMLVLETEYDYQRFGLDRRALADVLTIDAGGIARIDRQKNPPAFIAASPRPALRKSAGPPPPPPPTMRPGDGGVAQGVVGGVAGGVVDAVQDTAPSVVTQMAEGRYSVDFDAAWLGSTAQANGSGLEQRAVAESVNVRANAPVVTSALRPPVAAPLAPSTATVRESAGSGAVARQRRRVTSGASESVQRIPWTHPSKATEEEVADLFAQLEESPRDRALYNALSEALAERGEWQRARRIALQWQPYDPENPQVYEVLGNADEHLGNAAEAARAYASLIEVAPGKTELLQRAGLLLVRLGHGDLAETPLRRALELRPDRVNGYRHLAIMLWRQGRLAEAAQVLESATRQTYPQWYGDAQRVIHEELGYVYRAWAAREPKRKNEIVERAREFSVDLARTDALRITLAWETDANDVDLHVVDPKGEECYYSHKQNASGLELYQDITQGLGPEVIRTGKMRQGTYHVGVNYFAAGPMGVSRGVVIVMRDGDGEPSVEIYPFRLLPDVHHGDLRYITSIIAKDGAAGNGGRAH
ncbi:MAG: VIT domain-containing protein, partial [Acidobacteriota bacterium]